MAKERYISLKEAAEISGYSPDYVGQLIRSGKLQGKQVFSNVAWMTTEEAIRDYLTNPKKASAPAPIAERLLSWASLELTYKIVLWTAISIIVAFIIFLVCVLSITVDHRIDRTYQQQIEHV